MGVIGAAEGRELVSALLAEHAVPGVQVATVDGREVCSFSAGLQRRSPDEEMGDATLLQAASLSKPVFATAVLLTAHAGGIDLNALLVDYLPTAPPGSPELSRVTATNCLTHTAGLGAVYNSQLAVHHEPGERFSYSGIGYEYLGRAMREIWGEPVDAAIQRLVFDPLGITIVNWRPPPDDGAMAIGYIGDEPVPLWPWPINGPT